MQKAARKQSSKRRAQSGAGGRKTVGTRQRAARKLSAKRNRKTEGRRQQAARKQSAKRKATTDHGLQDQEASTK